METLKERAVTLADSDNGFLTEQYSHDVRGGLLGPIPYEPDSGSSLISEQSAPAATRLSSASEDGTALEVAESFSPELPPMPVMSGTRGYAEHRRQARAAWEVQEMYRDLKTADLIVPQLGLLADHLRDADEKRMREANARFLACERGEPVELVYPIYELRRLEYAYEAGWEVGHNEAAFYKLAGEKLRQDVDAQFRASLARAAHHSGLTGSGISAAEDWIKWMEAARGADGWREEEVENYRAAFTAAQRQVAARAARLMPAAQEIVALKRAADGKPDKAAVQAHLMEKSPEDIALVYDLVDREMGGPQVDEGYSDAAKVGLRLVDLPFRMLGGIAAGNDEYIQYVYQKSPFSPVNWLLNYDAPPTDDEAMRWTTAQVAFNDAFEAGFALKKTPLGPAEPVTVLSPPRRGDGAPGMFYVLEPGQKNPTKPSDAYHLEYPVASDRDTKATWVPALAYYNENSRGNQFVRFDGVNARMRTVYDAKWNTTSFPKQKFDIGRQLESLRQNPGWSLVVEVPTQAAKKHAEALYMEVLQNDFKYESYPTIRVKVVPPETRQTSDYDSLPMESPVPLMPQSPPGTPVMRSSPSRY